MGKRANGIMREDIGHPERYANRSGNTGETSLQNQRGRCPAHGAGGKERWKMGTGNEKWRVVPAFISMVSRAPQCADKDNEKDKRRGREESYKSSADTVTKQDRRLNEWLLPLRCRAPEGEKTEEKRSAGRKKRTAATVLCYKL